MHMERSGTGFAARGSWVWAFTAGSAVLALGLPGCASLEERRVARETREEQQRILAEYEAFVASEGYAKNVYRNDNLLEELKPEETEIVVSLSRQRALVMKGAQVALDTPVSTGKRGHATPKGSYKVLAKSRMHRSNLYGAIYDAEGNLVTGGASTRVDAVPEGGRYVGTAMPYWMRLTPTGIGLHSGYVPSHPASHGCVRVPKGVQPIIYEKSEVGTPVRIED
ncbi:MAG TPA: L,D-transpeptidase family protein [Verrucomicrobiales bacterium]|nr:L,D-transpeptidase family protein [Verrucomicrobiales bacterium]